MFHRTLGTLAKDYYKVLGVPKTATKDEIKKAYKKKAAQLHPDVSKAANAANAFSELNDAYETLKDEKKKKFYNFTGGKPNSQEDLNGFEDLRREQEREEQLRRKWQHAEHQQHQQHNEYDLNDKRWRRYDNNPWEDIHETPFYAQEYPEFMNFRHFDDHAASGGHWRRNPRRESKQSKSTRQKSKKQQKQQQQKGGDVTLDLQLSLDDTIKGCSKSVTYKKNKTCWECKGHGISQKEQPQLCGNCGGAGMYVYQATPSRAYEVSCEECNGKGCFARTCKKCNGKTVLQTETSLTTGLPPGLTTGCTVRVVGEGNSGQHNGQSGDLIINIQTGNTHQKFIRGADNSMNIPVHVSFATSVLGGNVKLKTFKNEEIEIVIKPNTPHLSRIILPAEGLDVYPANQELRIIPGKTTNLPKPTSNGKVYGYVVVTPPNVKKLSSDELNVLKKLNGVDLDKAEQVKQDAAGYVKARFGGK
eukprot:TRINITY_DN19778_c0_g1_i1.p1 TRINITY_DN19778_c0_g1~~TRINITY_DN19778_c0_g1_i1.p1  ORF type:complete len:474 (+),score=83.83 TRINITY_DN19778_c0_g1_i1:84-1505(+)